MWAEDEILSPSSLVPVPFRAELNCTGSPKKRKSPGVQSHTELGLLAWGTWEGHPKPRGTKLQGFWTCSSALHHACKSWALSRIFLLFIIKNHSCERRTREGEWEQAGALPWTNVNQEKLHCKPTELCCCHLDIRPESTPLPATDEWNILRLCVQEPAKPLTELLSVCPGQKHIFFSYCCT